MPSVSPVVAKKISEERSLEQQKKQLYSRQEYAVGAEAQKRFGNTKVLLVGATGPAAEIVKNLALTGVKSIRILDDGPIGVEELSTNFFFHEEDVGKTRSDILAQRAGALSRFVEISAIYGGGAVRAGRGCPISPPTSSLESILAPHLSGTDVLVIVNHSIPSLVGVNHLAREKNIHFVACESRGVTGAVFVDGGDSFEVFDADGEETKTCVITSFSPDGLISLHEEKRPECEVGSLVYFTGIISPAALNSAIPTPSQALSMNAAELKAATHMRYFEVVEVVSPYVLRIMEIPTILQKEKEELEKKKKKQEGGGDGVRSEAGTILEVGTTAYLHTTKKKVMIHFNNLLTKLEQPRFCTVFDTDVKIDAGESLHAIYRAVGEYLTSIDWKQTLLPTTSTSVSCSSLTPNSAPSLRSTEGEERSDLREVEAGEEGDGGGGSAGPGAFTSSEVASIVARAQQFYASLDTKFAVDVLSVFHGDLNPMACFIGGMASQEVLKLSSGKFTPTQQWLYYDARELLTILHSPLLSALSPASLASMSAVPSCEKEGRDPFATSSSLGRYSGQISVLGREFQTYLGLQRVFIVGAGALGCELIKNAALMGFGGISITDMDTVEMSNLSRQFLFRDHHIGQHKSTAAVEEAKKINPAVQITSYNLKVGAETEGIFHGDFWRRHGAVLNALDNVASRQYVDERCLLYQRPLFESGTLGTKCNTQCVIPFVTESYSQSYDPPEKSIPLCTLKNFPNAIEHTIQWARDQFERLFSLIPGDVKEYLLHFEGFARAMNRDPAAASIALQQVDAALRSWPKKEEDCIRKARLLYHEYFTETFHQLLHNIPLDKRNEDGSLFWSGAKKPPTPLSFQPERHDDVEFVYHTAALLAKVYGLPPLRSTREEVAAKAAVIEIPAFVPRVVVYSTSPEEDTKTNKSSPSGAGNESGTAQNGGREGGESGGFKKFQLSIKDLPPTSTFSSVAHLVAPEVFEKDNLFNHHMEFITSCSNLRALAYGIPLADLSTTKRIAGKIIPAMVTTTSLVTGLVGMEVLKYFLLQFYGIQKRRAAAAAGGGSGKSTSTLSSNDPGGVKRQHEEEEHAPEHAPSVSVTSSPLPLSYKEVVSQLSLYRNSFVNIALPLLAFSDPLMARARVYRLPNNQGTIRWSAWDRIDVNEKKEISVSALVELLLTRYSLEVSMISLKSGKMIYMDFGGKAKDKAKLISVLAKERGEQLQDGSDYLDLIVTGNIGEEDVDVPVVQYKFRNF